MDLFSLKGKIALLLGGGGDISISVAKAYACYGATLVLCDYSKENLDKARKELESLGIDACYATGDITDKDFLKSLADSIYTEYGKLDILFNSAGITYRKKIEDLRDDEWNRIVDVNINGTYYALKEFGLRMCAQKSGKIIQILSTGAYRFGSSFVAYSATKAAQNALIKGLAIEWAEYNIQVNGIAPTATMTNFTKSYYEENPEKLNAVIANHPYKRLGRADDYAGAAVYLASDASNFVNGEVIIIDSGKTVK